MDKFRYTREWEDKCRQGIGWKTSCARCLFEALCLFQQNQDYVKKRQALGEGTSNGASHNRKMQP